MEESYIRDYIYNLLDNTYNDDMERLKAIYYGIENILNSLQYQLETSKEKNIFNRLTTCQLIINDIIKENDI